MHIVSQLSKQTDHRAIQILCQFKKKKKVYTSFLSQQTKAKSVKKVKITYSFKTENHCYG